jgi:hypothetical protein
VITDRNLTKFDSDTKLNPCGLIAASLFLDTFKVESEAGRALKTDDEVAWPEDDEDIYESPDDDVETWYDVEKDNFKVWMRVGATNNFRKLYSIIEEDMDEGTYNMYIRNIMDEDDFGGEKYFVLSTTSKYGGKMDGFAILMLCSGIFSFVLALLIVVLKLLKVGKDY